MNCRSLVALALSTLLLCGGPAKAFESPFKPDSQEYLTLKKMGGNYQLLAEKFGCDKFAWASLIDKGKIADLEFVPAETKKIESWKRLVTVTVYSLSGKADTDMLLMNNILTGMMAQYKQADAKIIQTEYFHSDKGEPGIFIRYNVGAGDGLEHNAGVFMRSSANTASFIQLQSRGKDLEDADAQQVRALIQPSK